ncbi:MAG: response regulator [Acidobacteriota bacterium]|jgi:DNA-binding LytR/AlgR family response regulator|nr:response regulator [Acidobacteriota bacterium]
MNKLRVIIADDERPARSFLKNILDGFEDVETIGEAENGAEAVEIIKQVKPDLALLDLQMPEVSGLEVVKLLSKSQLPLVAFVTAYDEFAVQAFELNAIDYLLKPIEKARLRETLNRAHERLEQTDFRETQSANLQAAAETYEKNSPKTFLERIPIRARDEIVLLPVREVASIVADGELLHITTLQNEKYTINFRLKDIEIKLDSNKFVRLSRSALVNTDAIARVNPLPGGTYLIALKNKQEISSSRLQSRILRERLLKL